MGEFRFKKFSLINEKSALKVNTDGVLLGVCSSLSPLGEKARILDIGTGTGLVALLMCQRLSDEGMEDFSVTGVEIDPLSFEEAKSNFSRSPWNRHAVALMCSFERVEGTFTHILCNPPYFLSSLPNPDSRKASARHSVLQEDSGNNSEGSHLNWKSAVSYASTHLAEGGVLSLIVPAEEEPSIGREARFVGLRPFRRVRVRTVERKPFSRVVLEMKFMPGSTTGLGMESLDLTIQSRDGYTPQYNDLMKDFYLWAK